MSEENEKASHICILCGKQADLELDNGQWICEECARIQGELAEMQY